jgi:hypothetical protein
MAKAERSELKQLLTLIRRIVVLSMTAFGLWRETAYTVLAVRMVILWAVLYLSSEFVETVFRYLSSRAETVVVNERADKTRSSQSTGEKTGLTPSQ